MRWIAGVILVVVSSGAFTLGAMTRGEPNGKSFVIWVLVVPYCGLREHTDVFSYLSWMRGLPDDKAVSARKDRLWMWGAVIRRTDAGEMALDCETMEELGPPPMDPSPEIDVDEFAVLYTLRAIEAWAESCGPKLAD